MFKRRDFSKRVIFAIMGQPQRRGGFFCVIPTDAAQSFVGQAGSLSMAQAKP
jgi:hypothetical protein